VNKQVNKQVKKNDKKIVVQSDINITDDPEKECSVTFKKINRHHLKCLTCKQCFNMEVKKWIYENNSCPYCRSKWIT
jgi:hypothetical protein